MDRVGDWSVKRVGRWWRVRNRWTWMVMVESTPNGIGFEGGWAHTRHGALNAVDEVLREIRPI